MSIFEGVSVDFNKEKALIGAFSKYCKNYREILLTPLYNDDVMSG